MAEQCSGVSPRWFLLLTFFMSLSSCGVMDPAFSPRAELAVFRGPRGVLGGLEIWGLQSKQNTRLSTLSQSG